jgi:hypothetical protein
MKNRSRFDLSSRLERRLLATLFRALTVSVTTASATVFLASAMGLAIMTAAVHRCDGQDTFTEYTVLGTDLASLSDFNGLRIKTNLYKPQDETNVTTAYFTPFFIFRGNADPSRAVSDGMPKTSLHVDVQQLVTNPTLSAISLYLLVSPGALKPLMISQLKSVAISSYTFDRWQTPNLLDLQLAGYAVQQEGSDAVFEMKKETTPGLASEIRLVATLETGKANVLAEELRSGKRTLTFSVHYDLAAVRKVSSDMGSVVQKRLAETNAVKDLRGAATIGGVTPTSNDPTTVTRDQQEKLRGALKDELVVKIQVENPDAVTDIQKRVDAYVDKLFADERSKNIEDNFGTEISKISTYGFDPTDLKPDQIDKTVKDVRDFFSSDDQSKINLSFKSGGSYMGIASGNLEGSYSKEQLKKLMTDKGWYFEQEGSKFVPKGLKVYLLSDTAFSTNSSFTYQITKGLRALQELSTDVSTDTVCDPNFRYSQYLGTKRLSYGIGSIIPVIYTLGDGTPANGDEFEVPSGPARTVLLPVSLPPNSRLIGCWYNLVDGITPQMFLYHLEVVVQGSEYNCIGHRWRWRSTKDEAKN